MIAVIMAGGIGSRFWPLSREDNPKQFLSIVSQDSMIRLTVDRLLQRIKIDDIYVVTAASQAELVKKHIPELSFENIIIEPFGMNTAPCLALSLAWIEGKYDDNEIMLVAAADHLITAPEKFYQYLNIAELTADNGYLVTFGIEPSYPSTSYGYIQAAEEISNNSRRVASFKEKPDKKTAEKYLKNGEYYWNSGMFVWNLGTIRQAYIKHQKQIWDIIASIKKKWLTDSKEMDITTLYKGMPRIPVDIGIMEKSDNIAVVPSEFGWSDVGGWKALHEISARDEDENVFPADYLAIDSQDNYVYSKKLVSLIGVKNLVIIDTDDVIMVADKDRSEEVKKLVNMLKEKERRDYL